MSNMRTALVTMTFILMCVSAVHADTLPAAYGNYGFLLPDANEIMDGIDVSGSGFGSYSQQVTTNVGGMASTFGNLTYTSANGMNSSSIQAVVSTGGLFTKNVDVLSNVGVGYYLEIKGPDNTTVPLDVFASGSVSAASSVQGYALISQFNVWDANNEIVCSGGICMFATPLISAYTCSTSIGPNYQGYTCNNGQSSSFTYDNNFSFKTNTLYNVGIGAYVLVYPSTNVFGTAPLTSGTQLDPSFSIDPAYAATGLYTLETSDSGFPATAATPEPSSILLTITGVLCSLLPLARKQSEIPAS